MGLISGIMDALFGGRRNVIVETVEAFRENAEAGAEREVKLKSQTLAQFAAEFQHPRKGWFDRLIDGLNRLPRPFLAFGTLGLFVAAMVDPVWFASRMSGIALVPDPLWWLMGAIVSFYFGARHQAKTQEFQRSVADAVSRAPQVAAARAALEPAPQAPEQPQIAAHEEGHNEGQGTANPALAEWRTRQGELAN